MTPNAARTISCKAWNSPAEYPSWVARFGIKGSYSTLLNPVFWKKVQGQKHPGRWGIVEHQIPSIKVLFKTNTKCHKHPSIRLLSKSKTQLVNQRKQKVAFSPGTAHSPEIQSYRTWWGAASSILNDTPVVCVYIYIYIYASCNRTHIRNAYIYIYTLTQRFWTGNNVIRRKHIIQTTGFGACSSTCCQWDGEDVPAPWEWSNSHPPVRVAWCCRCFQWCILPSWISIYQ